MSIFITCPICQERYYTGLPHYCGNAFEVWEQFEDREDARTTYACDSEEAAKKCCEYWDSQAGDGPTNRKVLVCPLSSEEEPEAFEIEFQWQAVYYTA